jgi:hypothetical protein
VESETEQNRVVVMRQKEKWQQRWWQGASVGRVRLEEGITDVNRGLHA